MSTNLENFTQSANNLTIIFHQKAKSSTRLGMLLFISIRTKFKAKINTLFDFTHKYVS